MIVGRPTLSVIIPAFNAAPYVAEAIESVLAQRDCSTEIIVVDDASSDATYAIAAGYGERVILLRHDRQRGVSAARNTGLQRATGELVVFLDADDWFGPQFAAEAVETIAPGEALCYDSLVVEAQPAAGAAPVTLFSRALPWHADSIERSSVRSMFSGAPLLKSVVRRTDAVRVGGFDERFAVGEDFHFHLKLVAAGLRLRLVSRPCAYYRVHAAQVTAATSAGPRLQIAKHLHSCRDWIGIFGSLGAEAGLPADARAAARAAVRYWRYRYVRAALLAARGGKIAGALVSAEFIRSLPAAFAYLAGRR